MKETNVEVIGQGLLGQAVATVFVVVMGKSSLLFSEDILVLSDERTSLSP